MTDQTPEPTTDPRIENTVEQLAIFLHARDQKTFGHTGEALPDGRILALSFDRATPEARDEYLRDARASVQAMQSLGWIPLPQPEWGTMNAATGGRDAEPFTLVHDSLPEAIVYAAVDPNEQIVYRSPAIPAGPWQSPGFPTPPADDE